MISRPGRWLTVVLGGCLLAFAVLFGWQSWVSSKREQLDHLESVLALSVQGVDNYFQAFEADLRALASDLGPAPDMAAEDGRIRQQLARFQALRSAVVSVSLVRMDGQVVLTTAEVNALPSLGNTDTFMAFRAALDAQRDFYLGRPVLGRVVSQWVVPLRYVVRDGAGQPAYLISTALPVSFIQSFWSAAADTMPQVSIGLLGDDGYLLCRFPTPTAINPADLYGKPRGGALRQHLLEHRFPARGYVEGFNQIGGATFGNAFQRLPHAPLTMFVAVPTSVFRETWLRSVTVPYALLLMLAAAVYGTQRWFLARQREWQAQRAGVEADLARSEAQYRGLFETSVDAVLLCTSTGDVLRANPAACAMYGLSERELIERGRDGLMVQDERLAALIAERTQRGRASSELTAIRGDGTHLPVEVSSSAVRDAGGRVVVSNVLHDISTKARAEAALRDKLVAEQASRAKTEFIARISHELRTPMNAILGFAEVMDADPKEPLGVQQRERLHRIANSGQHLMVLINDLLDLSRIESGAMPVKIETLDLAELMRGAEREVAPLAAARGVSVECRAPTGAALRVLADRTRLHQVLLNLLSNAIKYNRRGGRATVTAALADPAPDGSARVRLAVRDDGLGLTAEQLKGLFQPFNRLGREVTAIEGAGIGLVIARSLVELMGGALTATSTPGEGSEFCVELRAAGGHADGTDTAQGGIAPEGATLREDVQGRVLYIDDDEVNRMVMQAFFSLRPGVELVAVDSGAKGVQAARATPPDLALIDLMMPDMDGHATLRALRAVPGMEAVRCIAVSANAMPEEIRLTLAEGFDGYLTKPVHAHDLFAEVDPVLTARADSTATTACEAGPRAIG